jgi:hypothetical protein
MSPVLDLADVTGTFKPTDLLNYFVEPVVAPAEPEPEPESESESEFGGFEVEEEEEEEEPVSAAALRAERKRRVVEGVEALLDLLFE